MNNDLQGLVVNSMSFGGSSDFGTLDWHLTGNPIIIASQTVPEFSSYNYAIRNIDDVPHTVNIDCGLILETDSFIVAGGCPQANICPGSGKNFRISLNGPIDLNGHNLKLQCNSVHYPSLENSTARIDVTDEISGQGNVHVVLDRQGIVQFLSPTGNSFTGELFVDGFLTSQVILNVGAGAAVTNRLAVVGDLVTVKLGSADQIGDEATVRLYSRTSLLMNGHNDTIGSLFLESDTVDPDPSLLDTGGAVLTVNHTISAENDNPSVIPAIKGKLFLAGGDHNIILTGGSYYGLDLQAELTGPGNITKTGAAALLLQGSNTFTGTLEIEQGVLEVRHANALGHNAGYTSIGAGALVLRNVHVIGEQLRANGLGIGGELPGSVLTTIGLCSWGGEVVLNTNLVVSGDMAFSGPIVGAGGLGFFGGDAVSLAGNLANTYTGTTLVRCPLLELNKPSGVKAFAGPLVVGGGAVPTVEVRWLNSYQNVGADVTLHENGLINLNGFNEDFGPVTFNGGTVQTGAGELGLHGLVRVNPNYASAVIGGKLGLPSGFHEFNVGNGLAALDLQVDAVVLGSGNLRKTGPGGMWLSGANTYGGITQVSEGALVANHAAALGAPGSGTLVQDGATLVFNFLNSTVGEPISIRGSGIGGLDGALRVLGNATLRNQFPSIFACLDLSTNATVRIESGGWLAADGFVDGTGPLIKTGAGTLVFTNSNANTYTGDTVVQAGTLELRKPNGVISIPGSLTLGPAPASAPAILRFHQSGALATSTPTVNANSVLDLNGFNYTVSLLRLNDGGDVQTGAGTLFLADFSTIQVGSLNPLGASASSSISGNLWPPDAASATLNVAQYSPSAPIGLPPELEVPANVIGAASGFISSLNKDGFGTARFSGNNVTFQGRLRVNGGTLIAANATVFGTTTANSGVNNGGRLTLEGNFTVTGESLFLNSANPAALQNRSGAQTWNGPFSLTQRAGISVSQSLTIPTAITGTGNLTKRGAGTLIFSGSSHNTYAGDTIVEAGMLTLAKSAFVQAVPTSLIVGQPGGGIAATALYQNHDQIWADITVNGGGVLDLNGWDEYAGDLTLNEGGDVQTLTGSLYVLGANGITVNPANNNPSIISGRLGFDAGNRTINVGSGTTTTGMFDLEISAVIFQANPTVNLTKAGAGRARFGGNNTYTGTTTVSAGVLQIDGQQPQSPVQVAGARLQGSGTVGHISFTGGGANQLAPGGSPGILTCGNLNAGTSDGGVLEIELNGPKPGIGGYDVVNVQGTVNLTGLGLGASLGFAPSEANQFVIVNNDDSDAIVGTFNSLPQNTNLFISGDEFFISYNGGSGNDVVLTRIFSPPPPLLLIETAPPSSVRLLWSTNDPDFQLQFSTNLPSTNWTFASPLPSIVGTNYVVTNATSGKVLSAVTTVAWYRLGEDDPGAASGLTVLNTTADSAGTNHLTQSGAPPYTSQVAPDAASRVGSSLAVQFFNASQYLSGAQVSTAVDNFGVEAWVRPEMFSSTYQFVAYNGNTASNGWGIVWQDGAFQGWYGNATPFGHGPAPVGMWSHVALVRDSGLSTLYVNGFAVGGAEVFTPTPPTFGFALGIRPESPWSDLFNGTVDEVRVFTFAPGQFSANDLLLNRASTATAVGPTRFYRLHKP